MLEKAREAIKLAEEKATELDIKITTYVVDEHGSPVCMSKMDGAFYISPKFAYAKAKTAALLRMNTGDIAEYAVPGKPYYGVTSAFDGELMTIEGGLPIVVDGNVIGAVGVGGSNDVTQDTMCAENALKAYE